MGKDKQKLTVDLDSDELGVILAGLMIMVKLTDEVDVTVKVSNLITKLSEGAKAVGV